MYCSTTNRIFEIEHIEEAHIRSQCPYFLFKEIDTWKKYYSHAQVEFLSKGHKLIPKKDTIYLVREGLLSFSRTMHDKDFPLVFLGKGSIVFEMHIIGHTSPDCSCHAIQDSILMAFPTEFIQEKLPEDPRISFLLMENSSSKYSALLTRMSELGSRNLTRNVARFISDMASMYNFQHSFIPPVSQQELADFFDVHRSSVNRAIASLRDENILGAYTKKHIEILDIAALLEKACISFNRA